MKGARKYGKSLAFQTFGPTKPGPEKKAKAPKRRVRVKPISSTRRKLLAEYSTQRDRFLRGRQCDVCRAFWASEVHHIRGRSGTLLCDRRFWLAVCPDCHNEIHNKPEWAKGRGYLAGLGEWGREYP